MLTDTCWEENLLRVEADLVRASFSLDEVNEAVLAQCTGMHSQHSFPLGDVVHLDTRNLPSPRVPTSNTQVSLGTIWGGVFSRPRCLCR